MPRISDNPPSARPWVALVPFAGFGAVELAPRTVPAQANRSSMCRGDRPVGPTARSNQLGEIGRDRRHDIGPLFGEQANETWPLVERSPLLAEIGKRSGGHRPKQQRSAAYIHTGKLAQCARKRLQIVLPQQGLERLKAILRQDTGPTGVNGHDVGGASLFCSLAQNTGAVRCRGNVCEAGEKCGDGNVHRIPRFVRADGQQPAHRTDELRAQPIPRELHEIGRHRRRSSCCCPACDHSSVASRHQRGDARHSPDHITTCSR
jgi:hypothetical protein